MNILDAIGNTPLIELENVVPDNCGKVMVKLESQNPTGSMKDRMAQEMISEAEKDGRLKQGWTILEYTGGSTGTSLALISAIKGYNIKIVTSDAFSQDKLDQMKAYGAELTVIKSDRGKITKELIDIMISTAREMSKEPETYWTDQLNNKNHVKGYYAMGSEIIKQTDGKIDAFVQVVGTSASITGVSKILRKNAPNIKIVAVEPEESAVLSGGKSGAHNIGGIGIGFLPPLWRETIADEIIKVNTLDAKTMARRLTREDGIFCGTSSGANVVAAIQVAQNLGPGSTVVTLIVDSGLRYLSGDLFK